MKRFTYRARDSKTGKIVKGAIQAESERTAGKLLIEQGFTPDKIVEEEEGGLLSRLQNKIRNKDKNVFTRQFATLIGAGLPLSNSLRVVAEQTQSKPMRKVIEALLSDVEAGKTLTETCQKYPDVFDNLYIALLRAGETSGTLDLSLIRLADQKEKDEKMMSDIRGALTYPAIILLVIIAVLIFMVLVVVPQVEDLYHDLGKELPWATAFLVGVSNFIIEQWFVVLIVLAVAVWFLIQFTKTDVGKRWGAIIKLNVPLFKGLFLRLYNARFARTAQNLLSTGVSIQDSLRISGEAIGNIMVQEQIEIVMEKVKQGKPLSESLKSRSYILPLVPQMASIGEQSGKIDEMLGKAATVYENELDEQIRTISTLIEPILMVVMALLVGFIVIAVLMPIYAIVSDVQSG
ncbi:type II secretion system F family protein [Candidatus Saccharibacteria bacterium]|nr:type II secretion system F family protein [Candidatus Saccharibacteria bacterium]